MTQPTQPKQPTQLAQDNRIDRRKLLAAGMGLVEFW